MSHISLTKGRPIDVPHLPDKRQALNRMHISQYRPHQLHRGDLEMGTAISNKKLALYTRGTKETARRVTCWKKTIEPYCTQYTVFAHFSFRKALALAGMYLLFDLPNITLHLEIWIK